MKKLCLLSFLGVILTAYTCQDSGERYVYTIVNNSDYPVAVQEYSPYNLDDTLYDCDVIPVEIAAHSSFKMESIRFSLEDKFRYLHKRGVPYLLFTVLDTAIVKKTFMSKDSCQKVREEDQIIKRYRYTLDDLRNSNWTVTYP